MGRKRKAAPEFQTRLAAAIRKYLNVHRMTYDEFAERVAHVRWQCRKCGNEHVIAWLSGRMPGPEYFCAIMEVIGETNPDNLFEPPPSDMFIEYRIKPKWERPL